MKKMMIAAAGVILTMMLLLAGCGSGAESTGGDGTGETAGGSASAEIPSVDLSQIEWNIEPGVVEGYRVVAFGYTNNTDYEIVDFRLDFKVRSDVTNEELERSDELKEKAESMDHDIGEMTFSAGTSRCVAPGSSVENLPCNLDGTVEYYNDFDSYELFEPDMLTVVLSDGEKVYSAYYDFASQKTTVDDDVMDAYTWPDSGLAKAVPKPEVRYLVLSYNDEDSMHVSAYGVSRDLCGEYIEACKAAGFDQNIDDTDEKYGAEGSRYFSADNGSGIKLDIDYYSDDEEMSIALDKEE